MKALVSENQARLTYLKRELVKTCSYDPPKRAIPARVKKLIKEIDDLEKEIGGDGEVLRRQSKNYIPW